MKAILLVGIPASGKSTWAREFIKKNRNYKIVSRDSFREMIGDHSHDVKVERVISDLFIKSAITLLANGYDVILDNTHLKLSHINNTISKLKYYADIEFRIFDISLAKAIERDKTRIGVNQIGSERITKANKQMESLMGNFTFNRVSKETYPIIYPVENDKPRAVVFDLDGTLAHITNRNPTDFHLVDRDQPNSFLIEQVNHYRERGFEIIIVSGRSVECDTLTQEWLGYYGIHYDAMFMRGVDDFRKDNVVKREIYETHLRDNYNIHCVFDDRLMVVEEWSKLGLFVFNVNQGNILF